MSDAEVGPPCGHPGCLSHVTHPCEGCGRVAGRIDGEDPLADVIELDAYRPHRTGWSTCRTCGHSVVSVILEQDPIPAMECVVCGEMAVHFDDSLE